jgi:hypothetical protein
MAAVCTSETSVKFYRTTRRYNPVVLAGSIIIALMMEATSTSKTSINFYQTTRSYNPEELAASIIIILMMEAERLHGATTQKTAIFKLAAVRTPIPT